MFIAETAFTLKDKVNEELAEDAINSFLGSLRMNGQVLGKEFLIAKRGLIYRAFLHIPEADSLDKKYANSYVLRELKKLDEVGLSFLHKIIGKEPDCSSICVCNSPGSYIVFTDYISLESPLRCGDCFGVVPLYKIPRTYDDEYYDIICWQSDYQACDSLQMNCLTGERFGKQQMSRHNSSLSKQGIQICNNITKATGIKTYYYLYRYSSLGKKAELNRRCPSCGKEWLLDKPLHKIFDFCCNDCLLLSNISWSVR